MSAYRSAVYSNKHGVGQHPGPKDAYEAQIDYSKPDEIWTGLNARDRSRLRNQVTADSVAVMKLVPFLNDPTLFHDLTVEQQAELIADYLAVRAVTVEMLTELGEEPVE